MTDVFVDRSLEEIRFWSRIMKEHFLKEIESRALAFSSEVDPQRIYDFN